MTLRSMDTSIEADAVQREIIAGLTGSQRSILALQLSEATRTLAMTGLKKRLVNASDRELVEALVELCYGRDTAERFRR
jgi:hypothetical protein